MLTLMYSQIAVQCKSLSTLPRVCPSMSMPLAVRGKVLFAQREVVWPLPREHVPVMDQPARIPETPPAELTFVRLLPRV